mmetsp:Transcript_14840/g.25123  ORF Transcript_14840/g.25123 Transcript_14840/m.25123 type:complete len:200 (+) Transcript_14840:385-984(+)
MLTHNHANSVSKGTAIPWMLTVNQGWDELAASSGLVASDRAGRASIERTTSPSVVTSSSRSNGLDVHTTSSQERMCLGGALPGVMPGVMLDVMPGVMPSSGAPAPSLPTRSSGEQYMRTAPHHLLSLFGSLGRVAMPRVYVAKLPPSLTLCQSSFCAELDSCITLEALPCVMHVASFKELKKCARTTLSSSQGRRTSLG